MIEDKLKESIRRLDELPPSKWDMATILKVKQWLFPRLIAYIDGYREKEIATPENAKEMFDKKEDDILTKRDS